MNDLQANRVIFLLIIFIILGILFLVGGIMKSYIISGARNASGNFSTYQILMIFISAFAIFGLLYWMFAPKITQRESRLRELY
jgi:formate hydrogenlyase subunit 3/multisubunit Na+/H+ antiporter MnhD subunit